jgi:hypothetical protein
MIIKNFFILVAFALGVLAAGYLVLAAISFVAMIDGGGSGEILDSMKNPYISFPILILAASTLLTGRKANKIVMKIF